MADTLEQPDDRKVVPMNATGNYLPDNRIAKLESELSACREREGRYKTALLDIRDHETPFLGTDCRRVAGAALASSAPLAQSPQAGASPTAEKWLKSKGLHHGALHAHGALPRTMEAYAHAHAASLEARVAAQNELRALYEGGEDTTEQPKLSEALESLVKSVSWDIWQESGANDHTASIIEWWVREAMRKAQSEAESKLEAAEARVRTLEQENPAGIVAKHGVNSGRPYIARTGTPVHAIKSRHGAGESIQLIAQDYELSVAEVEAAIQWVDCQENASQLELTDALSASLRNVLPVIKRWHAGECGNSLHAETERQITAIEVALNPALLTRLSSQSETPNLNNQPKER